MKYNINLLGAGRRFSFVKLLQLHNFNITSYELDIKCPISTICTVVKDTGKYNDEYILPLMDNLTIIKHPKLISFTNAFICYDKKLFEQWMLDHFPKYYPLYSAYDQDLIIKPRFGNSSKGIKFTNLSQNTESIYDLEKEKYVLQRKIEGIEYSVDCYFTKNAEMVSCIPRTRDRVVGGESFESTTVFVPQLIKATQLIGEKLGFKGPGCFQYMIDKNTGEAFCFEINARYGGACILGEEAGLNSINWIKYEYYGFGNRPTNPIVKWNLTMKRYTQEIFIEK